MPYSAFDGHGVVLGDQHVAVAAGGGVGALRCMSQQVFQERNTEDGMESVPGAAAAAAEEVGGGRLPDVEGGRRAAGVHHHGGSCTPASYCTLVFRGEYRDGHFGRAGIQL